MIYTNVGGRRNPVKNITDLLDILGSVPELSIETEDGTWITIDEVEKHFGITQNYLQQWLDTKMKLNTLFGLITKNFKENN